MIELAKLSLAELQHLLSILPKEIEQRTQEREQVLEELAALAKARGFELAELMRCPEGRGDAFASTVVAKPRAAPRGPAPVKFRHPLQAEQVWTGRGLQPRWVAAWLAEGKKIEELAV
ncbi:MAG: H-NS histone family protein [Proteobacteria bacterium]|nr:H-NS histone family protein [Pseudomonadota bacterium]